MFGFGNVYIQIKTVSINQNELYKMFIQKWLKIKQYKLQIY